LPNQPNWPHLPKEPNPGRLEGWVSAAPTGSPNRRFDQWSNNPLCMAAADGGEGNLPSDQRSFEG